MLQTSVLQLAPAALDSAMREQAGATNRWLSPICPDGGASKRHASYPRRMSVNDFSPEAVA